MLNAKGAIQSLTQFIPPFSFTVAMSNVDSLIPKQINILLRSNLYWLWTLIWIRMTVSNDDSNTMILKSVVRIQIQGNFAIAKRLSKFNKHTFHAWMDIESRRQRSIGTNNNAHVYAFTFTLSSIFDGKSHCDAKNKFMFEVFCRH